MKHYSKITKKDILDSFDQCMSDIQNLVKNQREISKENPLISPDKKFNFRSAIYWVYHLQMNTGILKEIGLEIIYSALDSNVFDEAALNLDVFFYYQQNKKKVA